MTLAKAKAEVGVQIVERWIVAARQLRRRAPSIKHHGPHSLRHACATRLINQGLSLEEVGDHLGHRDLEATRIYAKVILSGFAK